MIAVLLTGGRQPHGAQPGPALPGLTGKPRGRRYGHKEGRSVLVAPALSHLPVSRSQSKEKGRDPAGSCSPRPLGPSSRGLSKPKALAHLSPSLSPFSQPEGVAQLAGPSGALARPWSWLGRAACGQLPASRGREAKGCVLKGSTHCEKNPPVLPSLGAKQLWVARKGQKSSSPESWAA